VASSKLSGKDLLLLFLYAPGATGQLLEGIRGRTRLTKLLFIFKEEIYKDFSFNVTIEESRLPNFYPWNYGPFSSDVYTDIDFFTHIKFVKIRKCENIPPSTEEAEEYSYWENDIGIDNEVTATSEFYEELIELEPLGKQYIESKGIWERLSDKQQSALSTFKHRFAKAPLKAILKYVYDKYPEMTSKSKIKNKVNS